MSCKHETYINRFGDECCESCRTVLAWLPGCVSDGLYGDQTWIWVANTAKSLGMSVYEAVRAFTLGNTRLMLNGEDEVIHVFPVEA